MKIRSGFVSNSSSSSFICDFCGREEGGYDMSLADANMYMCINNHMFCSYQAIGNPKASLKEDEEFDGWCIPEEFCPVCARKKDMEKDAEYNEYLRLFKKFKHITPYGRVTKD